MLVAKLGGGDAEITVTETDLRTWRPTETIIVRDEANNWPIWSLPWQPANMISFDVETDQPGAKCWPKSSAFAWPSSRRSAYYIPVGHVTGAAQVDSGQMALFATEAQPGRQPACRWQNSQSKPFAPR
jgi:hypothetical protein